MDTRISEQTDTEGRITKDTADAAAFPARSPSTGRIEGNRRQEEMKPGKQKTVGQDQSHEITSP